MGTLMALRTLILDMLDMSNPERVATLRKQKSWTQQQLTEQVGVRVLQIRRYEILKHDANRFSATG